MKELRDLREGGRSGITYKVGVGVQKLLARFMVRGSGFRVQSLAA